MRLVFALVLAPSLAFAWGFDGHRRLASRMQDPLPAELCLRQWLSSKQTVALQDHACDPDRWRYPTSAQYDPNEGPRHYLEVDWVSPIACYPRQWDLAVAQLGTRYSTANGVVPWRVEELYGQLVAAFAAKDEAAILDRAFVLSHYVTDSFSVLHDTKNADPNGVHARWESDMLAVNANLNALTTAAAGYYGTVGRADPRNNVFDVAIVGNGLVGALTAADLATPGDLPAFYAQVSDLTARRWGDALTVMASMLWTAWADAGAPDLGFSATCARTLPTAEIVLLGYPAPGGMTHPVGAMCVAEVDGGSEPQADGGVGEPLPEPPAGCTCASTPQLLVAVAAALLVRRRRGRNGSTAPAREPRAG